MIHIYAVAAAVLFLASAAGAYVTGETLNGLAVTRTYDADDNLTGLAYARRGVLLAACSGILVLVLGASPDVAGRRKPSSPKLLTLRAAHFPPSRPSIVVSRSET